jgi:hypothetical protein
MIYKAASPMNRHLYSIQADHHSNTCCHQQENFNRLLLDLSISPLKLDPRVSLPPHQHSQYVNSQKEQTYKASTPGILLLLNVALLSSRVATSIFHLTNAQSKFREHFASLSIITFRHAFLSEGQFEAEEQR